MAAQGMKPKPKPPLPQKAPERCFLTDLHFDDRNPRFGPAEISFKDEVKVLDYIVETFGVEDVLSSLAVNGYFESEPLIGIREKGREGIHILEGNRRLAACLILTRDPRSKNQKRRREHFGIIHARNGEKSINPVPVFVFDGPSASKDLLPYLGVRHIVGSTDWDSYAKAAWLAKVVESGDLELDDVLQMIGDEGRQSERLLSAYYFVNQLKDAGRFSPQDISTLKRWFKPMTASDCPLKGLFVPFHVANISDVKNVSTKAFLIDRARIVLIAAKLSSSWHAKFKKEHKELIQMIAANGPAKPRKTHGRN